MDAWIWGRRGCRIVAIMSAAGPMQPAVAAAPAGLMVAPVQLSLADARRSVSTIVTNPGSAAIMVQVRLYGWTMRGEEEVYAPAADLGFSPPLFRLAPHAAQAVRIVARVSPGAIERSYRLIVDQLPSPDTPGQLQLPVRMVLPLFVEPAPGGAHAARLRWSARYAGGDRVVVTVVNDGTVHARLVDLSVDEGRGPKSISPGLSGYALAGQTRSWSFQPGHDLREITLTAEGGANPIRVTLPVTR